MVPYVLGGKGSKFSGMTKFLARSFSDYMKHNRNIGISAHIDSGKTTLTERILYYTGRIDSIHDVRGKDGVGAKMDSMELEREKGITIQSAATFCNWKDNYINIIDTPGHVDFTVEVERALRVLDGAVLVLCASSGVQSQTLTVDRQMTRYKVPRLVFINKLDRVGANPWKGISAMRKQLKLPVCALQIPIGLENDHVGVIDVINREASYFKGDRGENVEKTLDIPAELVDEMERVRQELVESLADVDETIADMFLMEEEPSVDEIKAAIRRQTIALKFVPVFMGSAYKNKGVQLLLDGVVDYLPSPSERDNVALDLSNNEAEVPLSCDPDAPLVALAFKLEESRYGQLTYMRVYQGKIKKGMQAMNINAQKKVKFPRLVKMHSNEMEDVESVGAGDVCVVFGLECASMDTFTDGKSQLSMQSMFVPNPVMSLSIRPKETSKQSNFGKAIGKFTREDPTLKVHIDEKSNETIMSGMGELHLDIYVERLKREYNTECIVGRPTVNYKETISARGEFNYLHKKQTGGAGQFARVIGYVEPLSEEEIAKGISYEFENQCIGTNIPSEYYPSCQKGAQKACQKGVLAGFELTGLRIVLLDGQAHIVDSSDTAFQAAMVSGIRQGVQKAQGSILEPIMDLEVTSPSEFQGAVIGGINKRGGAIETSDLNEDGSQFSVRALVPLQELFGYSTDLRSTTQGKGEFTMEYRTHQPVSRPVQNELVKQYEQRLKEGDV